MLSDANDTKPNKVSNKEIKLIDYSKYLYSDVNNRMYNERMEDEGNILDYEELVKSGEMLSKSDFIKNIFF